MLMFAIGGLLAGCKGKRPQPPPEIPPSAAEVKALADLKLFANRIHEWTLVAHRSQEEYKAALLTVRAAMSVRDPACETYLLQIAQNACGQYQEFSKEAAAQLVERGAARAELLKLVSEWRSDWLRAQAAMWALARDARPEEITLFDSIENAGFTGLDPGRFGGATVDTSMGRGVAGWVSSLSSTDPHARFQAILLVVAPLCVQLDEPVGTEYFWNPYFRRALSEVRSMYELDPRGTLGMLAETAAFPVANPEAQSPSGSPDPAELARRRAGWRDRLVAFLPASARDEWRSMSAR
jgi:hypothetical protein